MPLDKDLSVAKADNELDSVFYLAYGSNLAYETFQVKRGIKPLSVTNVVVPLLRLTFDLPSMPYIEPCFANTALRQLPPSRSPTNGHLTTEKSASDESDDEDCALLGYHKDRWSKGLVGVVYELTASDYARVYASEGGGVAYHEITVPCYPLAENASTVPTHPSAPSFEARTLYWSGASGQKITAHSGAARALREPRRDPAYAQPSTRYLRLINTGAAQHKLPADYVSYLNGIRPYTISTLRQRLAAIIYSAVFIPIMTLLFALVFLLRDKHGHCPPWLVVVVDFMFRVIWSSYDAVFKSVFGDGERSIADGGSPGV